MRLGIIGALVLFLFARPGTQTVSAATKVITEADKGHEVRLKTGDRIEVRLKSNPSTGYAWYLQGNSTRVLTLVHQTQVEATEPGTGRPAVQVFEFEARRSGEGTLHLHYVRSWEKPAADDEQFEVHVFIE
jgi:inhibitor of cysteine peptidase